MNLTIGLPLLTLMVLTVSLLHKIDAENLVLSNNFHNSNFYASWGDWGEWARCPEGTYATAFRLRNHLYDPEIRDNTGVNGIVLYCNEPGGQSRDTEVSSSGEHYGNWGEIKDCNNGLLNSFQLSYLGYQGAGGYDAGEWSSHDDAAVIDVWFYCIGDNPETKNTGMSGGGPKSSKAKWTDKKTCLRREAICGLRTQISKYERNQDNVGLNNVEFECCPIIGPASRCEPSDHMETVSECNNVNGNTPFKCSRSATYGTTLFDTKSETNKKQITTLKEFGINVNLEAKKLKGEFSSKMGTSEVTGHEWKNEQSTTFTELVTTTVSFDVPAGITTKLNQVVGECGPYTVRTTQLIRIDYDADGNEMGQVEVEVEGEEV